MPRRDGPTAGRTRSLSAFSFIMDKTHKARKEGSREGRRGSRMAKRGEMLLAGRILQEPTRHSWIEAA